MRLEGKEYNIDLVEEYSLRRLQTKGRSRSKIKSLWRLSLVEVCRQNRSQCRSQSRRKTFVNLKEQIQVANSWYLRGDAEV